MRAVILGGCGAMGSEATRDLATTSDFDEITIADLNREKAQALAHSLNTSTGRGHVRAEYIDASDEDALVALLRKQDVVVNTMTYHFGLQATRAAIRAGVNYLDLGGLHNTPKQLALDSEAQAAGVTIVLGCGATPGVTNILARRGADALDTVEAVHIAFASHRSMAPSPGLLDTMLDEFSPEASRFYYEDGRLVEVQPFDGARLIAFQPPVGEQEVYFVPHSETHTLPRFIDKGLRRVDVRGAWRPETMQAASNGHAGEAGDWAFLLYVEVKGTRGHAYVSHKPSRDERLEAVFDPTGFIAELARRGIRVEECIEEHGIIDNRSADVLSCGHAPVQVPNDGYQI